MLVHQNPRFSMIKSHPFSSKADQPRMAKPVKQPQIKQQQKEQASGQRFERNSSGKKADVETNSPREPLSPLTNPTTPPATSQVGDSTVSKDAKVQSRDLLEPKFADNEGMSSTSMPPLEDIPEIESKRIAPDQLYENVQDFIGVLTAGIDMQPSSKIDEPTTVIASENTERRAAQDMPAEPLPTTTTSSGRSGRESCDHTVRFADTSGPDPRQESRAAGSRPPKKTIRSEQAGNCSGLQPPQQQRTLIWPFRRNKDNAEAAFKMTSARSQPQPKSKPPTKISTSPMTDLIDTELLAAMDRKISWGKAKAYPGSVTLSELNDDGTGTSKTRSLRRIKKRKPAEEPPPKPRFEGMSLLRSILGMASASHKKTSSPPQPQVKSASRRTKQPGTSSRHPSDKDTAASGSKVAKIQKKKETRLAEPSAKGEGSAKSTDSPRAEGLEASRTIDSGANARAAEIAAAKHHSAETGSPDGQASGSPASEAAVPCTAVVPADCGTVAVSSD